MSVHDDAGWSLSAFPSGLVVFQNIEDPGPVRHLKAVDRRRVFELFAMLDSGEIAELERLDWNPGYG